MIDAPLCNLCARRVRSHSSFALRCLELFVKVTVKAAGTSGLGGLSGMMIEKVLTLSSRLARNCGRVVADVNERDTCRQWVSFTNWSTSQMAPTPRSSSSPLRH